jgi:hypothetical protein
VAEQFLNCPNVVTTFEQMRRKAVPESVAARGFPNAGGTNRKFHGVLQVLFRNVVPTCFAGTGIDREFRCREHVLPNPSALRVRLFSFESKRQVHFAATAGEVLSMQLFYPVKVRSQ